MVLLGCLVQPKDQGLPTTAYYAKTEVREVSKPLQHLHRGKHACRRGISRCDGWLCDGLQDGTQKSQKVFVNVPTEVGATEAEEIGASPTHRCHLRRVCSSNAFCMLVAVSAQHSVHLQNGFTKHSISQAPVY